MGRDEYVQKARVRDRVPWPQLSRICDTDLPLPRPRRADLLYYSVKRIHPMFPDLSLLRLTIGVGVAGVSILTVPRDSPIRRRKPVVLNDVIDILPV